MSRDLVDILAANVPGVARWAGAIARQLRGCDIVLGGKQSGVATTDALTLADDFPVAAHVARLLGGDAVWARTGRPIDFRTIWYDERSHALRLPGIVVYAADRRVVQSLVEIARDWNPERYDRP